jgi:hypothetical protein
MTLIPKLLILKDNDILINLYEFYKNLNILSIDTLYIFSVNVDEFDGEGCFKINKNPDFYYIEISLKTFKRLLEDPFEAFGKTFAELNRDSLFIFRDSNYISIKYQITKIEGIEVNLGRGGGQKSHLISPLELRINSYLLAMFNFRYDTISKLNAFDYLNRARYLPFISKSKK